jgi:HD-like signal output (HDOD) protein
MKNKLDIGNEIAENTDLLALPEAVSQILESASQEEISIESLSTIIGKDPALTGRLLKIANSPFYGLSHKVNTIHQAVMVLGMTTVKCLALSAALFNPDKLKADVGINISSLYGNILSIAITCRKLAVACHYPAPEDAFTCGLLHDIGFLYLLHHYPDEYRQILLKVRQDGNLLEEEKKKFAMAHSEIGTLIARKWHLPANIMAGISGHHNFGGKDSPQVEDIVRLAVALNRDIYPGAERYVEDRITMIGLVSERLGINTRQLDDIAGTVIREALNFAQSINIEVDNYETILARANQEIFSIYLSIQKLFRERQELTGKILEEERVRGVLEAKAVAISTLSHYVNNATMAIWGNSQLLRMAIKKGDIDYITSSLPRILDTVDDASRKIIAVLEEISEMNILDGAEFYSQSKILNIDERINARMKKLENSSGLVLPSVVTEEIPEL